MNSGKPINNRPQSRFEVIRSLHAQLEQAKEAGDELMLVEAWQLAWLVEPERLLMDADGTGEIAFNFENADVTRPHEVKAVRIASAADYIRGLDCEGATEEYTP